MKIRGQGLNFFTSLLPGHESVDHAPIVSSSLLERLCDLMMLIRAPDLNGLSATDLSVF